MVVESEQSTESPVTPQPQATAPQPEIDPVEQWSAAMRDITAFFSEIATYARYLASLQIDRAKLAAKRVVFVAIAGLLGLVVLAMLLAAAACLLLVGVAGWVGQAYHSFWIGATMVGVLVLGMLGLGLLFGWQYLQSRAIKSLRQKYAKLREQQKQAFGHDVKEAARG